MKRRVAQGSIRPPNKCFPKSNTRILSITKITLRKRPISQTHMEGRGGVNKRGAQSHLKAAQGIARHMEGAIGVNKMDAPSQRKVAHGIVWHMGEASGVNMRGA